MPFNFLHPFGFICRFPPVGLSTTSCLYAVSISEFLLRPCFSQQLPACIWFQYLGFPCLSTTSCAHLVSISNFPPCACHQTSLTSCIHWASLSILTLQGVQRPSPCDTLGFPPPSHSALFFSISTLHTSVPHLGAFTWLQYLNFPPLVPLTNFLHSFACSQDFTSGLLTTFCMHLNLVSMSKLPPLSLNNFLRSSGFNI